MFKGASKQSRQLSDLGKPSLGRLTVSLFDGKGLVEGNPITCSHIVSGEKVLDNVVARSWSLCAKRRDTEAKTTSQSPFDHFDECTLLLHSHSYNYEKTVNLPALDVESTEGRFGPQGQSKDHMYASHTLQH